MEECSKKKRGRPVGWRKNKAESSTEAKVKFNPLDMPITELNVGNRKDREISKNKLDVVKCYGDDCPRKESCLRYIQEPREKFQCYFTMGVNIKDVNNCQFYWEI